MDTTASFTINVSQILLLMTMLFGLFKRRKKRFLRKMGGG